MICFCLVKPFLLQKGTLASPAETTGTPKSSYELWHYTLFCEIEAGKAKVAKRLASMAKEEEKDNE
ncbi:hypothetical protein FGRA07_07752 [Fusarium graminearum]|nr:hypothetical protein FGRA07_07752 [Fusarium graminearum]